MAASDLTPPGEQTHSSGPRSLLSEGQTQPALDALETTTAPTTAMAPRPTAPKRTVGSHTSGSHPRPTGALPRVPISQPRTTERTTEPPRRMPSGLPRVTRLLPALDLTGEGQAGGTSTGQAGGDAGGTGTGQVGATVPPSLPREGSWRGRPSQPPRAAEAMERITGAMRALSLVHADATTETRAIQMPGADVAERRPVTIVAGGGAPVRIPASPSLTTRHPRARRTLTSAVMLVASVAMVVGALMSTHLVSGRSADIAVLAVITQHDTKTSSSSSVGIWYTSAGALSLGVGGGAGPGVKAPGSAGLPVKHPPTPTPRPGPPPQPPQGIGISPAPFAPWPPANPWMRVPGLSAFSMQSGGYYASSFGQCTWWAQYERRDEILAHMGNARDWASTAVSRGYRVGDRPAPGATVVFQPGTEGAGGGGHVAHVIRVYPGGWFLISEMNFYWNGGGWGRVDYRYVHSGAGVLFIY